MSDKKSDARLPSEGDLEKDAFLEPRSGPTGPSGGLLQQPQKPAYYSGGSASSLSKLEKSPAAAVIAYCLSSISMTIVNKYVVSGEGWNLNFFYLGVQVRLYHPSLLPW